VGRPSERSIIQPRPGLCEECIHARRIESDRGSIFFLCQLALTDNRFKKYPRLPVLSCAGYERDPSRQSSVVSRQQQLKAKLLKTRVAED
jgi:hypothetical protein